MLFETRVVAKGYFFSVFQSLSVSAASACEGHKLKRVHIGPEDTRGQPLWLDRWNAFYICGIVISFFN